MRKKVIAYICIVAIVFLFMYFRQSIYYSMNERDGFYIAIGHEPNDAVVDIVYDEDIFMISRSRAKSGSVSYHAFTRLSSDVEVLKEGNLDRLVAGEGLPEIDEMLDMLVLEDVYVLYLTEDEDGEDSYVILRLSRDGDYIDSYQVSNLTSEEILLYKGDMVLFLYEEEEFSYMVLDESFEEVNREYLYSGGSLRYQDGLFFEDRLYLLLEDDGQYGLYCYDLDSKETMIGAVDPKIKDMVAGTDVYLLEYSGDTISRMYLLGEDVTITEEIEVPMYRYYHAVAKDDLLYFYGGVTSGDELHASYGSYDGGFDNHVLDVPYNNYFLHMSSFEDGLLFVMRTNYLMDYQIRKTIYTEDDILYIID